MKYRQRKLLQARALEERKHLSSRIQHVRLQRDRRGSSGSPIVEASGNGNVQAVQRLIKQGADVNAATPEGVTPLITAAYGGYIEIVRLPLSHGADAALHDESCCTALDWARNCGHQEVALVLRPNED